MTHRFLTNSLVLAIALTTTSCYKATFYPDPAVSKGETHEEWTDFFVFGLVGTEDFKVEHFCADGDVTMIRTGGNFATGLVSLLTIGIYTPHKIYVSCAADTHKSARVLEIDATSEGKPAHAVMRGMSGERPVRVDQVGVGMTRLRTEGSES
jgi:hypothetical protein